MNPETTFAPRPAKRQVVLPFILPGFVALCFVCLTWSAFFSGCTAPQAATVAADASAVPMLPAGAIATVRARVAALVKKEVAAHPAIAPWANELAKVCFQFSGITLPSPAVLTTGFATAAFFVPSQYTDEFRAISNEVLALYTQDYAAAASVQGANTPYLTLLGQGIQDGVQQSGVTEAP